jgi:hypothetical protein
MSRAGDEMILELAAIMKTAAKKKEDMPEDKPKDKKKEDMPEDKPKDKKKEDDKKKKACVMANILNDLVKIANVLDESGATEASDLVDEALQIVLKQANEMPEYMPPQDASFDEEEFDVDEEEEVPEEEMEVPGEIEEGLRGDEGFEPETSEETESEEPMFEEAPEGTPDILQHLFRR